VRKTLDTTILGCNARAIGGVLANSLSLHSDKTRLIEFGRLAADQRVRRRLGKPETFHIHLRTITTLATWDLYIMGQAPPGDPQ